jgi:hypothetical protein
VLEAYVVLGEHPRRAGVVPVAEDVGEVLLERAAEGHVEDVHSPADPEHGQAPLERRARDPELEPVARGLDRVGLRVRLGAIVRRVGVARRPADDQRVEAVERVRRLLVGRQQHRAPARALDRGHVRGRRARGELGPAVRRHLLQGGGDADDRPRHNRSNPR